MEINIDLYSDFIKLNMEYLSNLRKQGFKFEKYAEWKERKGNSITNILSINNPNVQESDLIKSYEEDMVYAIANWHERIPESIPRKIYKCSDFLCPDHYKSGLALLEKGIKNGYDIFPFLSRQIYEINKSDKMMFILGVVHFHLGTKQDEKKTLLVEGTDDILYAFIQKNNCYFITIDKHGRWYDEELLRKLNVDFPEVLKPWKLNGVTIPSFSEKDRENLHDKNVMSLISINNEAYVPPGWGVSTAGTSINARFNLTRYIRYLDNLEKYLTSLLEEQQKELEIDFSRKIYRMDLTLISTDPIKILDKENNLLVNVTGFDDDKLSIHIINNPS